ncbi:MAG: hypothetical protein HKN91_12635 [Acidimicrobiia bacterium]|nr:hypothetical protein [Acidimicrobiia bacterium]
MSKAEIIKCKTVRSLGPDVADLPRLPVTLAEHSSSCLRCQAQAARYRKLRRELGALSRHSSSAPVRLLAPVDAAIARTSQAEAPKATSKVVATVAGATAVAASVVAVALRRRSRAAA